MFFVETLDSIVVSVATAAVIFAYQWVSGWLGLKIPAGRVWGNFRDSRVEVIITTAPETSQGEFSNLVFPAEAVAASEIQTFLARNLGADCRMNFSASFSESKFDRNLVVVGGPVHNHITKLLLENIPEPLGFKFTGHGISVDDGTSFGAVFSEGNTGKEEIKSDIGVVVHVRNPLSEGSFVTLIMGSRTFGCLAAARALLHSETKQFARRVKIFEQYAAIVSCKVTGRTVSGLQLERVWEISA